METFKKIFESQEEYFFYDDPDGIQELIDYIENNYKKTDYEIYTGRGDETPHGMLVKSSKLQKDKKFNSLLDDVLCDEEDPMDCY